ncbi:conjugal transfer protein TraG [Acidiphilium acidophilum]|uniref:conjugal transfer protein TraG n=1 Tax=Acidiphilium acidophilum TaxID=76588 RepID=UPI002E8E6B8A|nr:conjugal transfer protein TraG [Acidiphilium acidophilum]
MKSRLNCYFDPKVADQLTTFALRQGIHRSQLVEAAVMAFLSPDALDRREAAFVRRLDRLSRQMERIERDLTIAIEVQAQFVRFWLSASPPIPADQQDAAKARGSSRYQGFIETLGKRLQRGDSLVREISKEITPAFNRRDDAAVDDSASTGSGAGSGSANGANASTDDADAAMPPHDAALTGTEQKNAGI